MGKSFTFDFVNQYFNDNSYKLLENSYINCNTKMKYQCSNNHIITNSFSFFKSGRRCAECHGNKKYTIEFVKKFFEDNCCKLLESEYKNANTEIKYLCENNHETSTSFSSFRRGMRCLECSGKKKHSIEFVKKYFKDINCELLENDYKNSMTPMDYICECGFKSKIRFNNFQKGQRCKECSKKKARYSFEYIKKCFEDKGFLLLETEYKGILHKLKYICSCVEKAVITFAKIVIGQKGCRNCAYDYKRFTLKEVKKYFKDNYCELLENEYKNANTKMKYKCICGEISYMQFNHFKDGHRCKDCGFEKSSNSYLFSDYICPDGEIIRYQGYENIALDELYKIYKQEDINVARRNMPLIEYQFKNKSLRYYPDIFIKSENKMIEVKSYYIYKKCLIKNILKALATRKAGYNYEVWFYKPIKKGKFVKHII